MDLNITTHETADHAFRGVKSCMEFPGYKFEGWHKLFYFSFKRPQSGCNWKYEVSVAFDALSLQQNGTSVFDVVNDLQRLFTQNFDIVSMSSEGNKVCAYLGGERLAAVNEAPAESARVYEGIPESSIFHGDETGEDSSDNPVGAVTPEREAVSSYYASDGDGSLEE